MPRSRTNKPVSGPTLSLPKVPWPWVIVLIAIVAIIAASAYAVLWHGSGNGMGAISFVQIEHTPLPQHVPDTFLQEVQASGGFGSTLDLSDANKIDRLRDAFASHPWVRAVARVDTSTPNRLRVELRFRTPVAIVTVGRSGMFLDEEAVRLPTPRGSSEMIAGLLRMEGSVAPPRGEVGRPWGVPAVEAAARLAGILAPERGRFHLVAIEIDMGALEPELRLRTAGGTRVMWQTLPDDPGEKTVTVEEKLARLAAYCEQHGSLDKPAGPYLLDVRKPDGITRQPLKDGR